MRYQIDNTIADIGYYTAAAIGINVTVTAAITTAAAVIAGTGPDISILKSLLITYYCQYSINCNVFKYGNLIRIIRTMELFLIGMLTQLSVIQLTRQGIDGGVKGLTAWNLQGGNHLKSSL